MLFRLVSISTFISIVYMFSMNGRHLKSYQGQSHLYGYKHETFNEGERTRSRRANKIEVSSYERAVVASNAPRGITKVHIASFLLSLFL